MTEEVTFLKRKGGTVLLLNGRQSYKQREYKSGYVISNCSKSKKEKCRGSVTLKGFFYIIKEKAHSCQIAYIKNQIDEAINEMKIQASSSDAPIPQIYKKGKEKLLEQGVHLSGIRIPPLKSVQTALYTASRKRTNFKNVESVTDYQNESCRIIVFCSEKGRVNLEKADEFFVDGTFQSCPRPFEQLFTIQGDMGASSLETKVEPLVYALMSDRKQES